MHGRQAWQLWHRFTPSGLLQQFSFLSLIVGPIVADIPKPAGQTMPCNCVRDNEARLVEHYSKQLGAAVKAEAKNVAIVFGIRVGKFEDDREPQTGIYLHRSVARLDKGIPNPKERPVLPLPWSIEFTLDIYPNKEIKEQEIRNLVEEGGLAIGLGTFRGVFGKFVIETWE